MEKFDHCVKELKQSPNLETALEVEGFLQPDAWESLRRQILAWVHGVKAQMVQKVYRIYLCPPSQGVHEYKEVYMRPDDTFDTVLKLLDYNNVVERKFARFFIRGTKTPIQLHERLGDVFRKDVEVELRPLAGAVWWLEGFTIDLLGQVVTGKRVIDYAYEKVTVQWHDSADLLCVNFIQDHGAAALKALGMTLPEGANPISYLSCRLVDVKTELPIVTDDLFGYLRKHQPEHLFLETFLRGNA